MRRAPLGWNLLCLLALAVLACPASAQTRGEVESIGFNNHYRPDCWTPMVVRISPEKSGTFQLQVMQEDLDKDVPVFTRTITLTGKEEGGGEQRFWMYFIPQPTDDGLMDVNRGGTLRDLQSQVKVFLATDAPDGQLGKQLTQLPVTSTVLNLEPPGSNPFAIFRGTKLVLAVTDGRSGSQPYWREYETALGLMEQVVFVTVRPSDLPESLLGYDAVDAIVWLNADPPDASRPTEERRMRAIQQFVRRGGPLVICQTPERDRTRAWRDMLPVTVTEVADVPEPAALRALALNGESRDDLEARQTQLVQQHRRNAGRAMSQGEQPTPPPSLPQLAWFNLTGPFRVARAQAKPGVLVDAWTRWDADGNDVTPFIARLPYGAGCVTWVAQDLGDPTLGRVKYGWPLVWDAVFDWKNQTVAFTNYTPLPVRAAWERGPGLDLGKSFDEGMNLAAKSRAFVGLAVVFFVVYWLVAGPGLYLYLAARARAQLSWFLFAFAGVAATVLTILVVQLLVRGDPELQHVSIVRQSPGQPAQVYSRFGLYVPRDGGQEIALRDVAPGSASYVTAYAAHPQHLGDDVKFPANLEYAVPVREAGDLADAGDADAPVRIVVPYRSTLKKLEARWVGNMPGGVSGSGALATDPRRPATGLVTNGTGSKLRNVYFVFNNGATDVVLFKPAWDPGTSLDLGKDFTLGDTAKFVATPGEQITTLNGLPERGDTLNSPIGMTEVGWTRYWMQPLRSTSAGFAQTVHNDFNQPVMRSWPMLSLFDRLPPMRNSTQPGQGARVELLRRGARHLDVSAAVAAGQLVVLAESEANAPLPIPLEVEGDAVTGRGRVFYQFVLPLDRSAVAGPPPPDEPPATQPAPPAAPEPVEAVAPA